MRIAKWSEVFEVAESKRHRTLSWVSLPVSFSSHGYQAMVDDFGDEAPAVYGCWCALVCLAAQMPVRGSLCNSRGIPLTASQIARQVFFPVEIVSRTIDWAKGDSIKWIVEDDRTPVGNAQPSPSDCPAVAQQIPGLPNPTRPDLTQHNPTTTTTRPDQNGKVVEDVVVDIREAERQANKLARSQRICTQFTTQEIWEIAYAVTAIGNVDFCPSMVEAMKSGTIEKARGYVLASLRKAIAESGTPHRVADLRKQAGQWEDIKAAMQAANGVGK